MLAVDADLLSVGRYTLRSNTVQLPAETFAPQIRLESDFRSLIELERDFFYNIAVPPYGLP